MACKVVVGAQWGDEGKGKVIDILAGRADMVVRSQGGNNAGHTVKVGDTVYKLRLIPSGILYKGTTCCIANGVVVDPKALVAELDELIEKGIDVSGLKIDKRAHLIMPYHIALDGLSEKSRGAGDIGTTKKGIGPCYMDKAERSGIRFFDLMDPERFAEKVRRNVETKNAIITKVYGGEPLDAEAIIKEYGALAQRLRPFLADTVELIHQAIAQKKEILFEGAQGTLLDLDLGTYPYVTSSHPVTGGVCIGAGVGPTLIDSCLGVAKAYTTRVGKGPFPTELFDETGDKIREKGAEFGTVTGRARRCGWFDAVIMRFAVMVNGLTEVSLNKLDTLSDLGPLKICVAYEMDGKRLTQFPATIEELEKCTPVYEEVPGFSGDFTHMTSYDELPEGAKKYVARIEELIGCRVSMVGVGPGRDQNLER